jgi:hypothetical protein
MALYRTIYVKGKAFSRALIDEGENFYLLTAHEFIMNKVHRPHFIRTFRHWTCFAKTLCLLLSLLSSKRKTLKAIKPFSALAINCKALVPEHVMQHRVSVSRVLFSEFFESRSKALVLIR